MGHRIVVSRDELSPRRVNTLVLLLASEIDVIGSKEEPGTSAGYET